MTTTFKILEMSASTNEYHRVPTWRSHRLVRFWPWISFKVKWEGCWFNLVKTANRFGHEWSWSCSDGCKDMYIQNNYRRLRILILNHIRSIRAASLTWDHMWKIRIEKNHERCSKKLGRSNDNVINSNWQDSSDRLTVRLDLIY